MNKRELIVGKPVCHEIQIGNGIAKRYTGIILSVGNKGAEVRFDDPKRGVLWMRAGQLTELPLVEVRKEPLDRLASFRKLGRSMARAGHPRKPELCSNDEERAAWLEGFDAEQDTWVPAPRFHSNAVFVASQLDRLAPPPPLEPEPPPPSPPEAPPVSDQRSLPDSIVPPDLKALEAAGLNPWEMYQALGRQLAARGREKVSVAEKHVAQCDKDVLECESLLERAKADAAEARDLLRAALADVAKLEGK